MRIPILVAVADATVEQRIVRACARPETPVEVARRCVDLPDLLAVAAQGIAGVAVVGGLRRFDAAAVETLRGDGVATVALAGPDEVRALSAMGVAAILAADASPEAIAAAVGALVDDAPTVIPEPAAAQPDPAQSRGRVLTVWGPPGSPGRTLIATSLAAEFAICGWNTLLVDADTYAASVAQQLGLLDEVPGIAAVARAANLGRLDADVLVRHAAALPVPGSGELHVLSGLVAADRWPELRPTALAQLLDVARTCRDVVVVDCAPYLERDEELSHDLLAPRRNGATQAVLEASDHVIAVGCGDPVGLARLVRALPELRHLVPAERTRVVVNRVRRGPIPGVPEREIRAALDRFAGVRAVSLLPEDRRVVDAALASGRLLAESAPDSPLRAAIRVLATDLVDRPERAPAGGRRHRRLDRGWRSARATMSTWRIGAPSAS